MSTDDRTQEHRSYRSGPTRIVADAQAPARARKALSAAHGWTSTQVLSDATLVLSEIVSNVVRHTNCPTVSLEFRASPGVLHVEVSDCDATHAPRFRSSPPEEPGGLGMHIVTALCSDWGHRRFESGKCVWFDVAAAPSSN